LHHPLELLEKLDNVLTAQLPTTPSRGSTLSFLAREQRSRKLLPNVLREVINIRPLPLVRLSHQVEPGRSAFRFLTPSAWGLIHSAPFSRRITGSSLAKVPVQSPCLPLEGAIVSTYSQTKDKTWTDARPSLAGCRENDIRMRLLLLFRSSFAFLHLLRRS